MPDDTKGEALLSTHRVPSATAAALTRAGALRRALPALVLTAALAASPAGVLARTPTPTDAAIAQASSRAATRAYRATIADGRAAATDALAETGASSLSLALVDGDRVVWNEGFGTIDRAAGTRPAATTLYGIGSVSKMFTAMAMMRLVDKGAVDLDAPVVRYLPAFTMASPEYRAITVRMLLDHSAGLPGSDYRNAFTVAPFDGYAAQVLEGLRTQRLKTTPGAMSVYCNDCFTLAELVVAAVSGHQFTDFVNAELFAPLDMSHSRYLTEVPPAGLVAPVFPSEGDTAAHQEYINVHGSGGVFSTPVDMAHVAMMLMDGGRFQGTQVLSAAAVAEMGRDQTRGTLDPVKLSGFRYGLGWDTVAEPGLAAVDVVGWLKGGDTGNYHADLTVAPVARLAVIVEGAGTTFSSTAAEALGQRILLHALAERGSIRAMPKVLGATDLAVRAPSAEAIASIVGIYCASGVTFRVAAGADGALGVATLREGAWAPSPTSYTLRRDGAFWNSGVPARSIRTVAAWGRDYLVLRAPDGYGHYRTDIILGQRVEPGEPLSAAWQARVGGSWLLANEIAPSMAWSLPPVVSLATVPELPGILEVVTPDGSVPVDAGASDTFAPMFLVIPTAQGRDLYDLTVERRDGEEWLHAGAMVLRPRASVPTLESGGVVTIGTEGYAEWRSLPAVGSLTIAGAEAWKLFDSNLVLLGAGDGNTPPVAAPAGSYLVLFGPAGSRVEVTIG